MNSNMKELDLFINTKIEPVRLTDKQYFFSITLSPIFLYSILKGIKVLTFVKMAVIIIITGKSVFNICAKAVL